jgi:hypothetical protein
MLSGINRCDLPILYWRSVDLRNSSDDRPVGTLALLERIDVRDTAKALPRCSLVRLPIGALCDRIEYMTTWVVLPCYSH